MDPMGRPKQASQRLPEDLRHLRPVLRERDKDGEEAPALEKHEHSQPSHGKDVDKLHLTLGRVTESSPRVQIKWKELVNASEKQKDGTK